MLRNPLNTHIGATLFVVPVKISSILLQFLHLKSLTRSIYQFPLSFSSREVRTLDRITTSVQNLHLASTFCRSTGAQLLSLLVSASSCIVSSSSSTIRCW
ncbi:hypothetical protein QL285_020295 [Trifolium repens]|nr:hypothetical protein QL285_020295 [Trifolium repens]